SRPSAPVLVSTQWNHAVMTCSMSQTLLFLPTNWSSLAPLVVTGVPDYISGNGNHLVNVTFVARSSDVSYNDKTAFLPVTNRDIFWPLVFAVRPLTISSGTVNVTVTGAAYLPHVLAAIETTSLPVVAQNSTLLILASRFVRNGYH